MPRVVSNKDLIARGARLKQGGAVTEYVEPKKDSLVAKVDPQPAVAPVIEVTTPATVINFTPPVVAAPTIDTTPMADAVDRLASLVADAMRAQAGSVVQSLAPEAPKSWEFTVRRDGDGRIESIRALSK